MRLGLLGPGRDSSETLERAARFLLCDLGVDRAVYLDVDHALDAVVRRWAEAPGLRRPRGRCHLAASYRALSAGNPGRDSGVHRGERERHALKIFHSLPGDTARSIEILGGRVAVLIHDKDDLDEEDLLPASFLVFGASAEPVVKSVGDRWFLSPERSNTSA